MLLILVLLLVLIIIVKCVNSSGIISSSSGGGSSSGNSNTNSNSNSNTIDLRIISMDNDDDTDIVSIKGYGFGNDDDDVTISIGNRTCSNIEICSTVCQSCQYNHCSSDSVCIITKDKGAHCFMPCAGTTDSSCPCNTFCDSVRVHSLSTGKSSLLNLCTPRRLLSDDICGDYNTDRIHCKPDKGAIMSPSSLPSSSSSSPSSTLSPSSLVSNMYETKLSVNTNTTTFPSLLASSLSSCETNADCYDGSICTTDTCILGQCYSTTTNTTDADECDKYNLKNNKGGDVFYGYHSYINGPHAHTADATTTENHFTNYLVTHGARSTTSDVDDYPTEEILLAFSFLYFGTIVSSISINPNGVLLLPPFYDCHNVINSVSSSECIVYATDSNTISLWATDWDLSHTSTSNIYYYHQTKGDSSQLWGIDQTAFHVLYSNVPRYQANNTKSTSSFAASIYTDGSIHISYLHKGTDIMDIDVFGLWGSRASQYHSNRRYHEEKVATSVIENGTNIYYCNIETIGCIEEACVSPNAFVSLRWKKTSCDALADLSYSCVFGDVLATTTPMFSEADKNVLLCPVPVLPVKDGAIVALSIKLSSSNTISNNETIIRSITLADYELTQSRMTIKYSSSPHTCGCSSFHSNLKCDSANVCGGQNDIYDCFGTPFGSAYFDGCSKCSGGLSGRVPMKCFDIDKDKLKMWFSEVISFTMLLCFMSFALASFYVIFARMTNARQNLIFRESIRSEIREQSRGLTSFELECIGEQEYTEELFNNISNEDEFNITECSICLGKFKDEEHVRLLPSPCRHVFHISCIDEWFKLSTSCPLCKRNVRHIIGGGNGYEDDGQNRESARLSRVTSTEAIQILFNRVRHQTAVNRGLLELRRVINRGNARPDVNFSQIPQNEEA